MNKIISLAAYKAEKGIVPAHSPYYTSNATPNQINAAIEHAIESFPTYANSDGTLPYAIVIGYEDKKGRVKLLKSRAIYPTKEVLEMMGGKATMKTIAVMRKE